MRGLLHPLTGGRPGQRLLLALTAGCAGATSMAVLVVAHFTVLATGLVVTAIAGVLGVLRLWAAPLRDSLEETRRQALTDELTGLGNRRRLLGDLERAISDGTDHSPAALAMFDLDGFKAYNDSHGHPAGDALLVRLGARLEASFGGAAYRLGGDEFCVLLRGTPAELEAALGSALEALSEQGSAIRSSCGFVLLPREARDAASALRIVDRRMYAQKDRRRASTKRQARDLLLTVLEQHAPDVRAHSGWVGELARAVAERLGVAGEELDQIRLAGELHDVGKIAVPRDVLEKPGRLDEHELELVRRQAAAGEAILNAAPALAPIAGVVGAIHQWVNGRGYPEEPAGTGVPLGARVVAVCDCYDALTSTRPHQPAVSPQAALRELERGAGTRFDARVVEALREVLEHRPPARPVVTPATPAVRPPDLSPAAKVQGLVDIVKLVGKQRDVATLLDSIAESVGEALGLGIVVVNMYRPEWDDFWVASVHGDQDVRQTLLGSTYPAEWFHPILSERFLRRGAYVIEQGSFDWSVHLGDRYVPSGPPSPVPNAWQPQDELFVPFRDSAGTVLGVFSVGNPASGRRLSDEELDVLVAAATQAGVLVESAQAAALNERVESTLVELLAVSARLVEARSADEVLSVACRGVADAFHFQKVVAQLADGPDGALTCRAAVGWTLQEMAVGTPRADIERMIDPQFEVAGCYLVPGAEGRRRFTSSAPGGPSAMNGRGPHAWNRHWLLVPLRRADGSLIGVLWADDPSGRLLPRPRTLRAMRLLANQVAYALQMTDRRAAARRLPDAA